MAYRYFTDGRDRWRADSHKIEKDPLSINVWWKSNYQTIQQLLEKQEGVYECDENNNRVPPRDFKRMDGGHCYMHVIHDTNGFEARRWPSRATVEDLVELGRWAEQFKK